MIRVARKSIRRPWLALAIWFAIVVGFGIVGSQIEGRFAPSILVAEGTESARAEKLATDHFGDSVLTPIMLVGPADRLDKQGPALAAKLRTRADTRVLSPWDGTPGSDVLRPKKTAATIVAAIQRPEKEVIETSLPQIERTVDQMVSGPVKAHITGQASIDRAMRDELLDQTRIALAVAIPAMLIILTLVLRAPVAALVAGAFAVSVLPVGYGLTAIAAQVIRVDAVAIAGASMVGLAMGVGFGLLMVGRFREELTSRASEPGAPAAAGVAAAGRAGRPILIAGTAVVIAMILASSLSMMEILNSVGIGATLMAFVATAAAVGVLPAGLALVGTRVEGGAFGTNHAHAVPQKRFAALPAALATGALLLVLSWPVLSMDSGPPDAKLLPADNQARQDYEAVADVMGAGWVSPMNIIVTRGGSPVTTREFLGRIAWLERQTGRYSAVDSVLGPGALVGNANELQGVPQGLNTAAKTAESSKKDLKKLIAGLKLATDGVAQLRGGLGAAAGGAGQLAGGAGQAHSGSGQLSTGLSQANAGAQQLKTGAHQAAEGAKELAGGLKLAQTGVVGGMPAIDKLIKAVNSNSTEVGGLEGGATATRSQIAAAAAELAAMEVGRNDPHYSAVVAGLQKAASENDRLAGAITTAAVNARLNATTIAVVKQQINDLRVGIGKLLAGSNELATGLGKLSSGNTQLAGGISQLDAGGAKLEDGLRQLRDGAGQLATGLASGAGPSGELLAGMNTITGSVIKAREEIPSTAALEKLRKEAPGLFDSGYFVLAAIDGAPPAARDAGSFVVNVENGGFAGRITVVPKAPANAASTRALHEQLSKDVASFSKVYGADAAVGGTAASLIDYRTLGMERLPVVIAALALLTFAVLAIVTRAALVPALAVVLNLLIASAVFGVLSAMFSGDSPPLGGPGFVDPVTMIAVVTLVVALAIGYEVFTLEHLHLISGAGLAMLAIALAFAGSDITVVRQLAVGVAVGVVIDVLVARPLLTRFHRGPVERPTPGWRRRLHLRPVAHH